MDDVRIRRSGEQANAAFHEFASRVDGHTADVAQRTAQMIAVAVRLMRIPTAVAGAMSIPFILATLVLGLLADGVVGVLILIAGLAMAAVNGFFWGRRRKLLQAVEDPSRLATELGIMLAMTGRVDQAQGVLTQIAGGGGWRFLNRLRGVWQGTQMTGRWIDEIGDLPRARYFGPPKLGTSISITMAVLWLVPISIIVAMFSVIGTVAGSI